MKNHISAHFASKDLKPNASASDASPVHDFASGSSTSVSLAAKPGVGVFSKVALALVAAGMVATLAFLTGCSTAAGEDVAARMDDLEVRVKALEDKIVNKVDKDKDASDGESYDPDYPTTEGVAVYEGYLTDIKDRAAEAIDASEKVSVPSDSAQVPSAYQKAVTPLEDIEDQLGHLKDAFTAAHAQGTVSDDELDRLSADAQGVDDALDAAIDKLAKRMGVDA